MLPVVEFQLTGPFRRDEEDSDLAPMAYVEIVYKTRSWRTNVASRMSTQSVAVTILPSLPKCTNYTRQLQEAVLPYMVICLTT